MSVVQIACIHKISPSTAKNILKRYYLTGNANRLSRGGDHKSLLGQDQKNMIRIWVDEDPEVLLKVLAHKVANTFNIQVSVSTIDRVLCSFHYTLKDSTLVQRNQNNERTIELRFEYAQKFHQLECEFPDDNFVFLDKVGFQVVTRKKELAHCPELQHV